MGRPEGDGTARPSPGSGHPGPGPRGAGTRASAARRGPPAPGSRHPRPGFPDAPPPHAQRKKGAGRGGARPTSVPDWLPLLSIQSLFLMEWGGPPSLPQITFAASSQPVGPESAGPKRLGASELGPTVPRTGAPRPSPRRYILPHRPPPLVEAERRPRCSAEARCSEPGVAAGRSPWLGVSGGHAGGRGGLPRKRSDEKRGHPAPPETTGPCCHSPGAPLPPKRGPGQSPCGVGGGGRESWLAAHLLSLNPGEARQDSRLPLPLPWVWGIVKRGFCVPFSGHPGSVLLLSSPGLRPVGSLLTGRSGVWDWLASLPASLLSG